MNKTFLIIISIILLVNLNGCNQKDQLKSKIKDLQIDKIDFDPEVKYETTFKNLLFTALKIRKDFKMRIGKNGYGTFDHYVCIFYSQEYKKYNDDEFVWADKQKELLSEFEKEFSNFKLGQFTYVSMSKFGKYNFKKHEFAFKPLFEPLNPQCIPIQPFTGCFDAHMTDIALLPSKPKVIRKKSSDNNHYGGDAISILNNIAKLKELSLNIFLPYDGCPIYRKKINNSNYNQLDEYINIPTKITVSFLNRYAINGLNISTASAKQIYELNPSRQVYIQLKFHIVGFDKDSFHNFYCATKSKFIAKAKFNQTIHLNAYVDAVVVYTLNGKLIRKFIFSKQANNTTHW